MPIFSYGFALYLLLIPWCISGCDGISPTQPLTFDMLPQDHSGWRDFEPGILLIRNMADASRYQGYVVADEDLILDYDTHFVLLYFWGEKSAGDFPTLSELVRVERFGNTINLYYNNLPRPDAAPDEQVSPLDIIQIEKREGFTWDGELEVVLYHNDEEVLRTVVDFSTEHSVFLPYIQFTG